MNEFPTSDYLQALPNQHDFVEFRSSVPLILYRNTFAAVTAVLEARDAYTAHHSERVALMAERFGAVMHFPANLRELLGMTGIVHDIGKAGIPDSILLKQGKLTEEEWQVMKQHPLISEQIVMKSGRLNNIAAAVRSHHERWDGKGYPDGLSADQIPYISRILALCDSTDAMMSARVYRPSLGKDKCMEELLKNEGLMYQPALTEIFLQHWDEMTEGLYSTQIQKK